MKMLATTKSSSYSPASVDNSAMPRASPPANNVPNPRLNPLLSAAPTDDAKEKLLRINSKFLVCLNFEYTRTCSQSKEWMFMIVNSMLL